MDLGRNLQANCYQLASYSPTFLPGCNVVPPAYQAASAAFPPFPPMMSNQSFVCITYQTAYPPVYPPMPHCSWAMDTYGTQQPCVYYPTVSTCQVFQPCPPLPEPPQPPRLQVVSNTQKNRSEGDNSTNSQTPSGKSGEPESSQKLGDASEKKSEETCEDRATSLSNNESNIPSIRLVTVSSVVTTNTVSVSAPAAEPTTNSVTIVEITDSEDDEYPILLDEVDEDAVREAANVDVTESVANLAVKRLNSEKVEFNGNLNSTASEKNVFGQTQRDNIGRNDLSSIADEKNVSEQTQQDNILRKKKPERIEFNDSDRIRKMPTPLLNRKSLFIRPSFAERFLQVKCRTLHANVPL